MNKILRFTIPVILACLLLGILFYLAGASSTATAISPHQAIPNYSWVDRASLPYGIGNLGGDVIDGKIYVAGGNNSGGDLDTLFSFDPMSDTWQTLASLPSARHDAGTIAEGGKLYLVAGLSDYMMYKDLYVYTPGTNSWEQLADMPALRWYIGTAAWQGKLYVVGGNDEDGGIRDTVYVYTINTNTWNLLTTLPEARYGTGAAVVDGVLYVVGGVRPSGYSANTAWGYDLTQNSWSVKAPMPVAKGFIQAATKSYNGKVYVVGGSGDSGLLADVEVYDPLEDTWQSLPDLPKLRWRLATALLNGDLHAIGGYSPIYGYMADHTALTVITLPTSVTISGPELGFVGTPYTFTATVEPISTTLPLTYIWQTDGQQPITHTGGLTDTVSFIWDMPGIQPITVTASNPAGSVLASHEITISDVPISGLFASNDSPTVVGDATTFTAVITSGTNVLFDWDFGDGASGSGQVVSHTYAAIGDYTATVTATNSANSMTDTTSVTIIAPIYPVYLPLVIKSNQAPLAPNFSLSGGGVLVGLVIVGMVGRWKRRV
jgi:N-acetylneuraminic acid mutarotase